MPECRTTTNSAGAYKALKLTWADENNDNNHLDSPVVALSALTESLDTDKSFDKLFTVDSVSVDDELLTQEELDKLTLSQLVEQLNPYESGSATSGGKVYDDFIYNLKINGVCPSSLCIDQTAVSSMVESLKKDAVEVKKNVKFFDDSLNEAFASDFDEIESRFVHLGDALYELCNKYLKFSYYDEENEQTQFGYISLFEADTEAEFNSLPCYRICKYSQKYC